MQEPTDKAERIDRFKEFVRSQGYELAITDSGIPNEELLRSFKSALKEADEDAGSKTD
jgi:hypothetical protein